MSSRSVATAILTALSCAYASVVWCESQRVVEAARGGMYKFSLIAGKGIDVCEAYLKRLQKTTFYDYPFCDRPEEDEIDDFAKLTRRPLNEAEIGVLFEPVSGFTWINDTDALAKVRAERQRLGLNAVQSALPAAIREQRAALERGTRPLFFKFDPKVDLDNDGTPDDVVIWRSPDEVCGPRFGATQFLARGRTHILLLDGEGRFDATRTRSLFGYDGRTAPGQRQNWTLVNREPSDTVGGISGTTRPLSAMFGVFGFRGTTYVDSFYADDIVSPITIAVKRRIVNTLVVTSFNRKPLQMICEIYWDATSNSQGMSSAPGSK